MPFPLRILVNGLTACIRPRPAAGEIDFLLVDARHPTGSQMDAGMHPHEPFLAVRGHALSTHPGNRQPDRDVAGIDGDILAVFDLSREVLRIATRSPLEPVTFPADGEAPRTPADAATLGWIVSLERFGSGVDKLDPACFGDLATGPVVARMEITGGKISCQRLIRRDGDFQIFEFRTSAQARPKGPRKALGDLIAVEMTVDSQEKDGVVRITSSSRPALELAPPPAGERIDLVIGNLHLDHPAPSPADGGHFRWYYELLGERPPLDERPIPFAAALGPTTSASGVCPQMLGGI
jgi:hypothetical protein